MDDDRRIARQPDLDHRWTEKRTRETARKMAPTAAQTSVASGDMKDRNPGFCFIGFLIMILMPSSMNGALKSTTRSRADVMVMAPRATSVSLFQTPHQHTVVIFQYPNAVDISPVQSLKSNPLTQYRAMRVGQLTRRTSSPMMPSQPPVTLGFSLPYLWSFTLRSSSARHSKSSMLTVLLDNDNVTLNSEFGGDEVHHVFAIAFESVVARPLFAAFRLPHHHVRLLLH